MPLFITFEGIEGSGKTTQIGLLNDILKLRGYRTVLTREPGGTVIGEGIRRILLDAGNKEMTPLCELLLYAAGRAQHMAEVICPALEAKKIVLCDRFTDATLAYQGYGRGFSRELIQKINRIAAESTSPTLTILLDCDPTTGLARVCERQALAGHKGLAGDRFESEPVEFHRRVREGYLALARENQERFVMINSQQDVEAVHQEITRNVLGLLPKIS